MRSTFSTLHKIGAYPAAVTALEETLQAAMPEIPDHASTQLETDNSHLSTKYRRFRAMGAARLSSVKGRNKTRTFVRLSQLEFDKIPPTGLRENRLN
jgi:hypothetical protein